MSLLWSITPIIFVMVGIVVLKKPAKWVSLLGMIYTIVIAMAFFKAKQDLVIDQGISGIVSALQTMCVIFGAFTMLSVLKFSRAMDKINTTIADITDDRRIQVIVIAFCFGAFLEGAAGAGTPAAVAAPFLVGLGFDPLTAAAACLIANGIPASFGGAGLSTIVGTGGVTDVVPTMIASGAAGRLHMIGGFIVPTILVITLFGKKAVKGLEGFLVYISLIWGGAMFVLSNFIGPELTALGTGCISLIAVVIYVKLFRVNTPEEYRYRPSGGVQQQRFTPLQAMSPYLILVIALPVIRFTVPLGILTRFGYPTWVGTVIFAVAIIGSLILRSPDVIIPAIKEAIKAVIPAFIAMGSLLVLANIMNKAGMMSLIATTLANTTGFLYPAMAVAIGALGSFMTGSTLGSNIMFAPLQVQAAELLGMNPGMLVGAGSSGGALGNMVCPNNVVAVGITVGLTGQEGVIMKRVLKVFLLVVLIYGVFAMLYTHLLFPNYGL